MEENTKELKRQVREYRQHLKRLTQAVTAYLSAIDALMEERDGVERGQRIGRLTGQLEFANDSARHFGLGEKLRRRRQ